MRNINIFRTDVKDHIIPRHIMLRAMSFSPGKDWTDPSTEAYGYLKRWAFKQEGREEPEVKHTPEEFKAKLDDGIRDDLMNKSLQRWEGQLVPLEIINFAKELSPGKKITDKRTVAYKYLKEWVSEQNKNAKWEGEITITDEELKNNVWDISPG